jgi:phosphohistidine phosphatase
MFLYLMRHGDAIQGLDDSRRPLSAKGIQEAEKIARFLAQKQTRVDVFYHSTKQRAKETAEIVKGILNPKAFIEVQSGLAPNDPIEPIVQEILKWPDNVMVVSHLPFLGKLVTQLVSGQQDDRVGMPTASVVVLKSASTTWTIEEIIYPENILK